MDITLSITDQAQLLALDRALAAYNAGNPPLTPSEFLERLVRGQLDNLAQSYVVARVAPFDFLSRFTPTERAAIRMAAQTNAVIADYIAMVDAAPMVNLTSELTTTGVNSLESAGLIGAGRAAQILAL